MRIALTGVRVFEGETLSPPRTVVFDGGVIGTEEAGAERVDAAGAVLLPGLIDAHLHLHEVDTLRQLGRWGVTTALDMATWPAERVAAQRGLPGLPDIRSAGTPAIGPGGPHAQFPDLPADAILRDGAQFVADRVREGVDYVKIVLEAPGAGGPDPAAAAALVEAAHQHGKSVVAHAASRGAYVLALDLGVDIVTHVPMDAPLGDDEIARMAGRVSVPTLTMERALGTMRGLPEALDVAMGNVTALHQAGVPVLAGTDAAVVRGLPPLVAHGESLHDELELLVRAGLSPAAALRAATSGPARHFGLADRGAIAPGLRADAVLIDGDLLEDISATRRIQRVWCAGVEQEGIRS
ncbi:amidohydrolase family protein [Amycolatopsis rubida]|uniref:Imidazolonepropionase n=1 Tax=Amycolatopsis rubida TaxID=112413 RepID=A0A1I5KK69_9PSEU|nr:amidohydrolase family protein [Amycolatopsis rubida]SFO84951.1 Imidazolonepropionase [Amycolatopsis rubida]